MRTSVLTALFLMLILSFRPIKEDKICTHCDFVKRHETKVNLDPKQPKPYIHPDTMFEIQPIINNIDEPKQYRYFNEFKMNYRDLHYCSDSTRLTIYLPGDSIRMWNIRPRISCKIEMWYRLTESQEKLLSTYAVKEIKIENRVTDNIYRYKLTDPNYFTKVYDLLK